MHTHRHTHKDLQSPSFSTRRRRRRRHRRRQFGSCSTTTGSPHATRPVLTNTPLPLHSTRDRRSSFSFRRHRRRRHRRRHQLNSCSTTTSSNQPATRLILTNTPLPLLSCRPRPPSARPALGACCHRCGRDRHRRRPWSCCLPKTDIH